MCQAVKVKGQFKWKNYPNLAGVIQKDTEKKCIHGKRYKQKLKKHTQDSKQWRHLCFLPYNCDSNLDKMNEKSI